MDSDMIQNQTRESKFGLSPEVRAKSSFRQDNSAIILVLGEFRPIYLDSSLNFRAPPHQTSPKI
jgi:hypothetical protein